MFAEAEKGAYWLLSHGIGPGSVVMTAARTSKEHVLAILEHGVPGRQSP